jgi:hypothetical protein
MVKQRGWIVVGMQMMSMLSGTTHMPKYYCTDLSISIVEIVADTEEEAEAVMNKFIDRIAPIMKDKVRWDECDWEIKENILNEKEGVWVEQ